LLAAAIVLTINQTPSHQLELAHHQVQLLVIVILILRSPGKPIETNRDVHHNYYFRVRTKLDENGNVVSARYGKIYGDFMQFSYYLNPTPNDRNVEFDPKQNLITSLKFDEGVSQP
jgi:hypothetical protein